MLKSFAYIGDICTVINNVFFDIDINASESSDI